MTMNLHLFYFAVFIRGSSVAYFGVRRHVRDSHKSSQNVASENIQEVLVGQMLDRELEDDHP